MIIGDLNLLFGGLSVMLAAVPFFRERLWAHKCLHLAERFYLEQYCKDSEECRRSRHIIRVLLKDKETRRDLIEELNRWSGSDSIDQCLRRLSGAVALKCKVRGIWRKLEIPDPQAESVTRSALSGFLNCLDRTVAEQSRVKSVSVISKSETMQAIKYPLEPTNSDYLSPGMDSESVTSSADAVKRISDFLEVASGGKWNATSVLYRQNHHLYGEAILTMNADDVIRFVSSVDVEIRARFVQELLYLAKYFKMKSEIYLEYMSSICVHDPSVYGIIKNSEESSLMHVGFSSPDRVFLLISRSTRNLISFRSVNWNGSPLCTPFLIHESSRTAKSLNWTEALREIIIRIDQSLRDRGVPQRPALVIELGSGMEHVFATRVESLEWQSSSTVGEMFEVVWTFEPGKAVSEVLDAWRGVTVDFSVAVHDDPSKWRELPLAARRLMILTGEAAHPICAVECVRRGAVAVVVARPQEGLESSASKVAQAVETLKRDGRETWERLPAVMLERRREASLEASGWNELAVVWDNGVDRLPRSAARAQPLRSPR